MRALNDYFLDDDYLFYIMETITINPGEKNQVLHHDDSATRLPRPRPPVTAATMIVLDDYTTTNGATRIIPGSHKWGWDRVGEEHEAISAVCPTPPRHPVRVRISETARINPPNYSTVSC